MNMNTLNTNTNHHINQLQFKLITKNNNRLFSTNVVPDVAEGLHKVLADEGHSAVSGRYGQSEGAAASLSRNAAAAAVRRAAAAAARVAVVAARAAALPVAVLQIVQAALFRLHVGVVAVALVVHVQLVHFVDVLLLLLLLLIRVVRHQVVARWTERQPHDAVLLFRQDRFVVLPVLQPNSNNSFFWLTTNSSSISIDGQVFSLKEQGRISIMVLWQLGRTWQQDQHSSTILIKNKSYISISNFGLFDEGKNASIVSSVLP